MAALVDRYKRLIYSIPIKQGMTADDAADIRQSVCLDLVAELSRVREPEALPQWLIQTTIRKCQRHRQRSQRGATAQLSDDVADADGAMPDSALRELQQEQALRDALDTLQPRCRQIIEMLFFQTPPRPYAEVASRLGLAIGSVGFIRGRCLDKLRASLHKAGL